MKKKMKKGQAVLSAWTLIAAMGVTPVLSVSYPNGIATVYAKEAVNEAVWMDNSILSKHCSNILRDLDYLHLSYWY